LNRTKHWQPRIVAPARCAIYQPSGLKNSQSSGTADRANTGPLGLVDMIESPHFTPANRLVKHGPSA